MARSRFWIPLSPGGRTDPSNYWFTGKPHTQTSTCRFYRIIRFSINLLSYVRYMERSESIATEEEDRKQEEEHIRTALHTCSYPDWAIKRVKEQMNRKAIRKDKSKKDKAQEKSRGVVTVPYIH